MAQVNLMFQQVQELDIQQVIVCLREGGPGRALLLKARQAMAVQVTCCAPLARTVGDGGFERTLLPHRHDPCQAGGACHAGDVREQAPSRVPPSLSCPPCTRPHLLSHKCGYESYDMTHITPVSPSSHLRHGRLYVPC